MSERAFQRSAEEDARRILECGQWYDSQYVWLRHFADTLKNVLDTIVGQLDRKVLPTQVRVKSRESYLEKCLRQSRHDRALYRYQRPLEEIEDLVGARITLYLLGDGSPITTELQRHLVCDEQTVSGAGDRRVPGYQGRHFKVRFTPEKLALPDFAGFAAMHAELQLRTVLQHAWAEVQHDLIYKPRIPVPVEIQRRLVGLAGILDVADREFESVTQSFETHLEATTTNATGDRDRGLDLKNIVDKAITLPALPSMGPEWIPAFQEVLNSLGVDTADLTRLLDAGPSHQQAVTRVLSTEEVPNKVQIANALLAWRLGEAYAERHPRAQGDASQGGRLREQTREWITAFEAEAQAADG